MMKFNRKMMAGLGVIACMLMCLVVPILSLTTYADEGRMIIAISASTVQVGDDVSITVTAHDSKGSSVTTDMKVQFDANVLQYTSSNASSANCSGSTITAKGKSITFKFSAIASGSCAISAYGTTADGNLTAAGVRIRVSGEGEAQPTPTPTPTPTPEPTPTPQPSAEPEPSQEPVEQNTGDKKKIIFTLEGKEYRVSNDYDVTLLEKGFHEVDVMVQGKMVKALQYGEANWIVLYLISTEDDTVNGYYLFDAETGELCPYIGCGIEGEQAGASSDELTLAQANYSKLYDRYTNLRDVNRKLIIAIIVIFVVTSLVVINLLIFRSINRRDEYDEYEEDEFAEDDYDESDLIEEQGKNLEKASSHTVSREAEESQIDLGTEISAIMKNEKEKESRKSKTKAKGLAKEESKDGLEIIDLEDL